MCPVSGLSNLVNKLNDLSEAVAGEKLGGAILAGGSVLEGKIKISMGEQKSGRMYGKHQASAPGEAPAIDMGLLVNSIGNELVSVTATKAEGQVFTNAEYGPALEFGTAHVEARPFMRPAAHDNEEEIGNAVRATLVRLIEERAPLP